MLGLAGPLRLFFVMSLGILVAHFDNVFLVVKSVSDFKRDLFVLRLTGLAQTLIQLGEFLAERALRHRCRLLEYAGAWAIVLHRAVQFVVVQNGLDPFLTF